MTITHSSFRFELDDILLEIKELSKNLFIEKYVNVPEPASLNLLLLNVFFYQAGVPSDLRKIYGVTTGLIQMGLDLHETVNTEREQNVSRIRNRQLSILAGDYYSSHYYALLSKKNLIDGVKKLAKGIRNVNIAKMMLYTANNGKGFDSIQHVIDLIKVRESNLYIQFLDFVPLEKHRSLWKEILEETILLFYLSNESQLNHIEENHLPYYLIHHYSSIEEQKEFNSLEPTDRSYKMKKLFHKYDIRRKMEDISKSVYYHLQELMESVEDRVVKSELISILHLFSEGSQMNNYNKTPANI